MKWKHAKDSWRQTAAGADGKATLLEGTVPRPRLRSGSGPGERPGIRQPRRTSGEGRGQTLRRCQHFYFLPHKARLDTNNGTHWQPFRKTMRGKWATANPGRYANPSAEIRPSDPTPLSSLFAPPHLSFPPHHFFPLIPPQLFIFFFVCFFSGSTIWCWCPGDGPVSGWQAGGGVEGLKSVRLLIVDKSTPSRLLSPLMGPISTHACACN